MRTLNQAGFAFRCILKPTNIQIGQVVTVGTGQVGNLVVGNLVIGACTLGPNEAAAPSTGATKLDTVVARHAPRQIRR